MEANSEYLYAKTRTGSARFSLAQIEKMIQEGRMRPTTLLSGTPEGPWRQAQRWLSIRGRCRPASAERDLARDEGRADGASRESWREDLRKFNYFWWLIASFVPLVPLFHIAMGLAMWKPRKAGKFAIFFVAQNLVLRYVLFLEPAIEPPELFWVVLALAVGGMFALAFGLFRAEPVWRLRG